MPTPKLAFEGAARGNLRAARHQHRRSGRLSRRRMWQSEFIQLPLQVWCFYWNQDENKAFGVLSEGADGFYFPDVLTCLVKLLNSVNSSVVKHPRNWCQNSWAFFGKCKARKVFLFNWKISKLQLLKDPLCFKNLYLAHLGNMVKDLKKNIALWLELIVAWVKSLYTTGCTQMIFISHMLPAVLGRDGSRSPDCYWWTSSSFPNQPILWPQLFCVGFDLKVILCTAVRIQTSVHL